MSDYEDYDDSYPFDTLLECCDEVHHVTIHHPGDMFYCRVCGKRLWKYYTPKPNASLEDVYR